MTTTASVIERLYADREFTSFLRAEARRHFKNPSDIEDAIAEAWRYIAVHLSYYTLKGVAHTAMNTANRRALRERTKEDYVLESIAKAQENCRQYK